MSVNLDFSPMEKNYEKKFSICGKSEKNGWKKLSDFTFYLLSVYKNHKKIRNLEAEFQNTSFLIL